MRNAWMLVAIVGGALWWKHRQAARAAVPVPATETAPQATAAFLGGGSSPDVVLGADRGYQPLRSAWG